MRSTRTTSTNNMTQESVAQRLHRKDKEKRIKCRDDFRYYALKCLKITPKSGFPIPLVLNQAQRHVDDCLEKQLKETGMVRALILKGRQQGISTLIEGRFLWKITHKKHSKAFILTNTAKATKDIFKITKTYYDNLPLKVKPVVGKDNAGELDFTNLKSSFNVSTAGGNAVGRGTTIQYFHGSEVAFWDGGDEHISGVLQAIPRLPGTEIILESTANGAHGLFYKFIQQSLKGSSQYQVIFVPWHWDEGFVASCPPDFVLSTEETAYKNLYSLSNEHMMWRRMKIEEFLGDISKFRREYPATIKEAFKTESEGALWKKDDITVISKQEYAKKVWIDGGTEEENEGRYTVVETVIAYDPAGTSHETSDESGIILATLLSNEKVYIRKDESGRWKQGEEVINKILALYYRYNADRITVEKNYGGDWITNSFDQADKSVPIYSVHAKVGKALRAQPVAFAYSKDRVVHVGHHFALEDEMITWEPNGKHKSPNRIDALVYAVTDLLDFNQVSDEEVFIVG